MIPRIKFIYNDLGIRIEIFSQGIIVVRAVKRSIWRKETDPSIDRNAKIINE